MALLIVDVNQNPVVVVKGENPEPCSISIQATNGESTVGVTFAVLKDDGTEDDRVPVTNVVRLAPNEFTAAIGAKTTAAATPPGQQRTLIIKNNGAICPHSGLPCVVVV